MSFKRETPKTITFYTMILPNITMVRTRVDERLILANELALEDNNTPTHEEVRAEP